MGLFDKVTQTASNVGKNVMNSAVKLGSSATVAMQEQNELLQLKSQITVINQELDSFYVQIGRRYIDYVLERCFKFSKQFQNIDFNILYTIYFKCIKNIYFIKVFI